MSDEEEVAGIDAPPELVIGVEGLDAVQSGLALEAVAASDTEVEQPGEDENPPPVSLSQVEDVTPVVVDLQAEEEAEPAVIELDSEPEVEDAQPSAETSPASVEETETQDAEATADPVEPHQVDETRSAVGPDDQPAVEVPDADIPAVQVEQARGGKAAPKRARRRLTARLGMLLLDAHLIAEKDLDRALKEHQITGERLGYYLVDKGMVDEADLAQVLADQYGVPAADLENVDIPSGVLGLVSEKMARRYMVLPLAVSEGAIDVAMVDPADVNAIQDIEFATGLRAQPLIATEWALERAIQRLYAPEAMRTALSGRSARKSRLKDPRAIIKRIIRDRDEAVMQAEHDPHSAYDLAASLDEFVDEILRVARKIED
jgi:hypothetical protein